MSFNVPTNQLCTSSLAHWQGINFVDGDMDEKKRNRHAGEKGRGSVVLETLNRKRDSLMNEGKKLQNVGQWQQEMVASEHSFLAFCPLIASVRLFACLSAKRALRACQGWLGSLGWAVHIQGDSRQFKARYDIASNVLYCQQLWLKVLELLETVTFAAIDALQWFFWGGKKF